MNVILVCHKHYSQWDQAQQKVVRCCIHIICYKDKAVQSVCHQASLSLRLSYKKAQAQFPSVELTCFSNYSVSLRLGICSIMRMKWAHASSIHSDPRQARSKAFEQHSLHRPAVQPQEIFCSLSRMDSVTRHQRKQVDKLAIQKHELKHGWFVPSLQDSSSLSFQLLSQSLYTSFISLSHRPRYNLSRYISEHSTTLDSGLKYLLTQ